MADIATNATPKTAGFASRGSNYAARQANIDKEEKEIEELMKAQAGTPVEEDVEDHVEEEEVEAKSPYVIQGERVGSSLCNLRVQHL
mgnify:CR=1 FL=1